MHRRIETLLDNLGGAVTRPESLRVVRGVAVLESIASPEARKLLEALAQGVPEVQLTQEAKGALSRIENR